MSLTISLCESNESVSPVAATRTGFCLTRPILNECSHPVRCTPARRRRRRQRAFRRRRAIPWYNCIAIPRYLRERGYPWRSFTRDRRRQRRFQYDFRNTATRTKTTGKTVTTVRGTYRDGSTHAKSGLINSGKVKKYIYVCIINDNRSRYELFLSVLWCGRVGIKLIIRSNDK